MPPRTHQPHSHTPHPTPPTSSFQVPPSSRTDPLATLYQILSVQSLHYLTLCIFIPPLLSLFLPYSSAPSLYFEGGPAQIGMILDWRELSSRHTFDWSPLQGGWLDWRKGLSKDVLLAGLDEADQRAAGVWSAGSVWFGDLPGSSDVKTDVDVGAVVLPASRIIRQSTRFLGGGAGGGQDEVDLDAPATSSSSSESSSPESDLEQWEWSIARDPSRGWAIAGAWVIACAVDVFLLTTVVRRPKHILDHVATLHLVHLLLTSWYTSSIPTSLFWWTVMIAHGVAAIVWAERQAIQREMSVQVGRGLVGSGNDERATEEGGGIPLSVIGAPSPASVSQQRPHVLFDEDEHQDSADEDAETDTDTETSRMIGAPKMMVMSSSSNGSSNKSKQKGHKS